MKTFFEYKLTPKSPSLDMYREGMVVLALITDEIHGVPTSRVNRYHLNVGKREIEVSLLNRRIPKEIIQKLSEYWNIEPLVAIDQIA